MKYLILFLLSITAQADILTAKKALDLSEKSIKRHSIECYKDFYNYVNNSINVSIQSGLFIAYIKRNDCLTDDQFDKILNRLHNLGYATKHAQTSRPYDNQYSIDWIEY